MKYFLPFLVSLLTFFLSNAQITTSPACTFTFPTSVVTNVSCNGGSNGAIKVGYNTLTPALTSDNTGGGISYNVTVNNPITLMGFNLNMPLSSTVKFYYRNGTATGNELSSAGWTLGGEATLTAAGTNNATSFVLATPVSFPAGSYGFYIVSYSSLRYLNGTGSTSNVWASNSDITIYEGTGRATVNAGNEFGVNPITSRKFSGSLLYQPNSPAYTYVWSTGATSRNLSGLTAGNYSCTLTDGNGCTSAQSFTVTEPTALTSTTSQTNVSYVGSTNGTATVVPSGGTGTKSYSWSPSGITTATATGLSAGNYTCLITDANGCSISKAVTISLVPISWTGATSNDFNTASNWNTNFVPATTDSITVPSGTLNSLNISSNTTLYDFTVLNGATVNNSAIISVKSDFRNEGSILGSGSVELNGTTAQKIFGTGLVNNLTLNNSIGANITSGMVTISNLLKLTSGVLTTNGLLTLKSDASNTASVGVGSSSGNYINGNVIVQRFIPSGRRAFRFLSHPFSNSLALSTLTDNIDITGTGGNPLTTTITNAPSAFSYDNSVANSSLASDPGWLPLTASSSLAAKTGYRVLVRGSKGQSGSLTGGTYVPNAVTIDWVGTLNQGDQTVTLTNNGTNRSYSLVSNPFASTVDLSTVTLGSNINANFSIWNPNLSTKGAYQTQPFSTPYLLPSGAAFFTQSAANTNNTITFTETSKSTSAGLNIFRSTQTDNILSLQINDANGNFADNLAFYFNADKKEYTANNDLVWDAVKLPNPEINFFSFSNDGIKLSIDRRPIEFDSIPLGFTSNEGIYYLVVKDLPITNKDYYLYDHDKKTSTMLKSGTSIQIVVNSGDANQAEIRFTLVAKEKQKQQLNSEIYVSCSPNPVTDLLNIAYKNPSEQACSLRILTETGQELIKTNLGNNTVGSTKLNLKKLVTGLYILEFTAGNERTIKQIVKN